MSERSTILLVDDDPIVIQGLARSLEDIGRLCFATSSAEAWRLVRSESPDLVLLDVGLPDGDGIALCADLRREAGLAELPVMLITAADDPMTELRGLEAGAVDFIHKPPSGPVVRARVRTHLRLKHMADALRRAADTDGLTGVANRRRFEEALAREWLRAQRSRRPIALLMADVDHFKAYNDRYGHVAGDRCLREVACAMAGVSRRPADLLARYGGEEFALLLPETDLKGAEALAIVLRDSVAGLRLLHEASGCAGHVSVSVGASAGCPMGFDPTHLVAQADAALYQAKAGGRNGHRARPLDDLLMPGPVHPGALRLQAPGPVHPGALRLQAPGSVHPGALPLQAPGSVHPGAVPLPVRAEVGANGLGKTAPG